MAKNLRSCPVLGRSIAAAECGESRHSQLACPVTCPFDPFTPGNYDRLMALEAEIETKSTAWIAFHDSKSGEIRSKLINSPNSEDFNLVCQWAMHVRRDAAGLTAFDRYIRAGESEWSNDQRLILAGRQRMKARILELKRRLDGLRIEVADGLDLAAGDFIVCDRKAGPNFERFRRLLVTTYDLPHFVRIVGASLPLDFPSMQDAVDAVRAVVVKSGGPGDPAGIATWVFDHLAEVAIGLKSRG